jgi:hypothetical protein
MVLEPISKLFEKYEALRAHRQEGRRIGCRYTSVTVPVTLKVRSSACAGIAARIAILRMMDDAFIS